MDRVAQGQSDADAYSCSYYCSCSSPVSLPLASCCAVLSFFGVIILLVLGIGFDNNVEVSSSSLSGYDRHSRLLRGLVAFLGLLG